MTAGVPDGRTRLPRPLSALILGAIALATALALVWPSLPWSGGGSVLGAPTRVGIVSRQIEAAGAAGTVGAPAPDFEWVAADGRRVSLGSLRPKPVVVNFWATWCPPCLEEMPLLDRAAAAHPEAVFLAVDLDEDGATIRRFFDDHAITHLEPLLDVGLDTARHYGLASAPTTYFVDAGGTIRSVHVGQLNDELLQAGLEAAR